MAGAKRWVAVAVAAGVVLGTAVACGSGSGSGDDLAEGVRVDARYVGPVGTVHDVVARGDQVDVLASRKTTSDVGLVLHSADGGSTWAQANTHLPVKGDAVGQPRLFTVGDALIATRTWELKDAAGTLEKVGQSAAISRDGGASWSALDLPVPSGSGATIIGAAAVGKLVVLAGHIAPLAAPPYGPALLDHDTGVWTSTDEGRTFQRVTSGSFAPTEKGDEQITRVMATTKRVVLVRTASTPWLRPDGSCCDAAPLPEVGEGGAGAVPGAPARSSIESYASSDGKAWTDLGETWLAADPSLPDRVDGDRLEIGDYRAPVVLAAGSDTWEQDQVLPPLNRNGGRDIVDSLAEIVPASDGAQVGTWNEDSACDCSEARAARIVEGKERIRKITYHGCHDTSGRGYVGIDEPHVTGDLIVAAGWCDDDGQYPASLVTSTDHGRTWTTTRLTSQAPEHWSDLLVPLRYGPVASAATVRDGVVLATVARRPGRPNPELGDPAPAPIVLLRITAAS
ncbi:sialidase family protein [Aquihabitans sp. McL0605]|uniref:sialidase family protein n=1 Tax=Aquihabitans sp. McL0605 TaxID=3415671 RepID=UPI003CE7CD10